MRLFNTKGANPEITLGPWDNRPDITVVDLRIWPSILLDSQLEQLATCSSLCPSGCSGPSVSDCTDAPNEEAPHCADYSKDQAKCLGCVDGFTLKDDLCVSCYYSYSKCKDYKKYDALACISGYYLLDGDCLTSCPSGWFRD